MATAGKVIRCRAAVCWEFGEPLSVEEVEVQPPQQGEVRIQIVSTTLCHSDLTAMNGAYLPGLFEKQLPFIPGHEAAGIVESVGPGVTTVKPGDHVIPYFSAICDECPLCLTGRTNACMKHMDTRRRGVQGDGKTRFTCRGKPVYTMCNTSTFSEYTVMDETQVAKLNPNIDLKTASVLGCCVPTGVGSALNTAGVTPGSTCAVWGVGAVGLAAILGCKIAGAKTIVAVDINPSKEAVATKFGATDFVNPKALDKPIAKYMQERFFGGVDYAIEAIGTVPTMMDAYKSIRMGGGVCVILGVAATDEPLPIQPKDLIAGRQLRACFLGDYRFRKDLSKLEDAVQQGKIRCADFITNNVTLEDINKAVDTMEKGEGIRTRLHF